MAITSDRDRNRIKVGTKVRSVRKGRECDGQFLPDEIGIVSHIHSDGYFSARANAGSGPYTQTFTPAELEAGDVVIVDGGAHAKGAVRVYSSHFCGLRGERLVAFDGSAFTVVDDKPFDGRLSICADRTGSAMNLPGGTVLRWVSPKPGMPVGVAVAPEGLVGGVDPTDATDGDSDGGTPATATPIAVSPLDNYKLDATPVQQLRRALFNEDHAADIRRFAEVDGPNARPAAEHEAAIARVADRMWARLSTDEKAHYDARASRLLGGGK